MNPTSPIHELSSVTISSGGANSDALNLGGRVPTGLYMPATWTAADITFELSGGAVTWFPVYLADGTQYTATVAASRFVSLTPEYFMGGKFIRLVSSVNQGADRTISLALSRPVVR